MYADSAVTTQSIRSSGFKTAIDQSLSQCRRKELLASASATKQSYTNLEAARATVDRKKADLENAQLQLSYTRIIALS